MKEFLLQNNPVKIWARTIEPSVIGQINNLAALPFVFHHLAFMPDVHLGIGMPIGGVLATKDIVIPNAVGVDIGCGMCAVKTSIRAEEITPDILRKGIMRNIRKQIPIDKEHHKSPQDEALMPKGFDIDSMEIVSHQYSSALKQLGTLGGGNHFIELQRDTDGWLWVMIHSGSRNLGKRVCDHYADLASKLNTMWYSNVDSGAGLSFLPKGTKEFSQYWNEMRFCIEFAFANRKLMMDRICSIIKDNMPNAEFEPIINIAHNYAAFEEHFGETVIVHRKGATRAYAGEIGIIPGSQGTRSFITEGLGNPDSFMSCSHGAGRAMSRNEAVRTLNLKSEIDKLDQQGIVHSIRSVRDLEEAASAYKNIEVVMADQVDLTRIVTALEPIAVIKG